MNGMKQGLIIGAVAGLFFGFMLGRYGVQQANQAARADLVDKKIKPALAEEKWVVSDRFYSSTIAFQAAARYIQAVQQIGDTILQLV